jgi:hypothetical protein
MDNINWGVWLRGLISAFANGATIAVGALMLLPEPPKPWRLLLIAVFPMALQFFSYLKQTPPPIGKAQAVLDLRQDMVSTQQAGIDKDQKAVDKEKKEV